MSWRRDIRLARARLIVPDGYLRSEGLSNDASFGEDCEVWSLHPVWDDGDVETEVDAILAETGASDPFGTCPT